jgi:MFS family permease
MPLAALIVITILAHSAFNGSRVTISLYALSLGASPLTVGLFISLYSALPMFLGVAAGRMIDRVGMRGPLLVSTTVLVAAVALPGLVPALSTHVAASSGFVHGLPHRRAAHGGRAARRIAATISWLALGFATSSFIGPVLPGF